MLAPAHRHQHRRMEMGPGPIQKIITGAAVWRFGGIVQLGAQPLGKLLTHLGFPMLDKHQPGLGRKILKPADQAVHIGMAADARQAFDVGVHLDVLPEQPHPFGSVKQRPAQGVFGLIAHKQDGVFPPPQIVLQMVADAPRFTHSAGRQNHLAPLIKIDGFGFFRRHRSDQAGKSQGIFSPMHHFHGFFVKIAQHILPVDVGGLDGQGAVQIDGEIIVAPDQPIPADLVEEI